MTADIVHTGACMCGAVKFEAHGTPKWVGYCHCQSCRKHTGAPMSAYAGYERDHVRFLTPKPRYYSSSEGVRRGFCGECGSTLSYEGERWPTEIHFHIGAFDRPEDFPPTGHAFKEERLPWLHVDDL
jgi:hypothetical protein